MALRGQLIVPRQHNVAGGAADVVIAAVEAEIPAFVRPGHTDEPADREAGGSSRASVSLRDQLLRRFLHAGNGFFIFCIVHSDRHPVIGNGRRHNLRLSHGVPSHDLRAADDGIRNSLGAANLLAALRAAFMQGGIVIVTVGAANHLDFHNQSLLYPIYEKILLFILAPVFRRFVHLFSDAKTKIPPGRHTGQPGREM